MSHRLLQLDTHISGSHAPMWGKSITMVNIWCWKLFASSPTSSLGMRLAVGTSWWIQSHSERWEYDWLTHWSCRYTNETATASEPSDLYTCWLTIMFNSYLVLLATVRIEFRSRQPNWIPITSAVYSRCGDSYFQHLLEWCAGQRLWIVLQCFRNGMEISMGTDISWCFYSL